MNHFDPLAALRHLSKHQVRFVIIGGIAARLMGSPTVTGDLDICHDLARDNLERLADALREAEGRLRDAEEVEIQLDATFLTATPNLTFATNFGALDCLGHPAGGLTYEQLVVVADHMSLEDLEVQVCSLQHLMRMKQAAGRPKDMIELEVLGALRDELEGS